MTEGAAVIDMNDVDLSASDDKTTPFSHSNPPARDTGGFLGGSNSSSNTGDFQQTMSDTMTRFMWETGKTQATKAWSIYGNIDLLRPYFDVEPKNVIRRIVNSLVPKFSVSSSTKVVNELYGPTMLVLTLIALLLYEMKSSGHTVKEGTLIGTAFGTCFGYWIGCGTLVWLVAYLCNTHLSYLQIISMLGYSLTSHCLVVLVSTLVHTSHDHMFFYLIWTVLGGLSSLRMVSILFPRTHGPSQKLIISGVASFLHLMFLLYLHFAYHQVVEELDDLVQDSIAAHKDSLSSATFKSKISKV